MKDISPHLLRQGLERRHKACIDLQPGFDLIVEVYAYIDYINKHPVLDRLFSEKIQASARSLADQIKQDEAKAEAEISSVYAKIKPTVTNDETALASVKQQFDEIENLLNNRIISSRGKAASMHTELMDVIEQLHRAGFREKIKDFVSEERLERAGKVKVRISVAYELYEYARELFKKRSHIEPWGAFDEMYKAYDAVNGYIETYKDNVRTHWPTPRAYLGSVLEQIKQGKLDHLQSVTRNITKSTINRLHLALLDEIDWYEDQPTSFKKIKKNKEQIERVDTQAVLKSGKTKDGPGVFADGNNGYFRFKRNSNRIPLGRASSLPYKLIVALIYPFESWKSVQSVFEEVYGNKYKDRPELLDPITASSFRAQRLEQIEKELQRIEEFQNGRLRLNFTPDNKRKVRLTVEL